MVPFLSGVASSNRGNFTKAKNPMVIHYVFDMARAKTFYSQVFDAPILVDSPGWSTLDVGGMELALHISSEAEIGERLIPQAGLNIEVDSIEEVLPAIIRFGGRLVELREPSGNIPVRLASCKDSEGNGFELRQPVI